MPQYIFATTLEDTIWYEAESARLTWEIAELPSYEDETSYKLVRALDVAPVTHL